MMLRSLHLQHVRLHQQLRLDADPRVTLIAGPNGSGKSTVLEALQLFSIGSSVRAQLSSEMIALGQELGRVTLVGVEAAAGVEKEHAGERSELTVLLTRGVVNGRRTVGKLWSENGVRRAQRAVVGQFRSVLFRPEDMRLIEGSRARRRDYLNSPLTQLYPDYAAALAAYDQYLTRRNKLLLAVREGEQPKTVLTYWNEGLLKHGTTIQHYRRQFFAGLPLLGIDLPFSATYLPSIISAERQLQYLPKEIAAGHTLIGPHKDDFDVGLPFAWLPAGVTLPDNQPPSVMIYGSRGQQRLAVLWLKLCEAAYLHSVSGSRPVLLLDDILSELDATSRARVQALALEYQTILTTIDEREGSMLFPAAPITHLSPPQSTALQFP